MILQVSQGAIRYAGLDFATAMVKTAAAEANVPVVLHLDHGTDFDQNVRCLRAGFTSLMFDGSKKPYEENVATTARVVADRPPRAVSRSRPSWAVLQSTDGVSEDDVKRGHDRPRPGARLCARAPAATRWPSPSVRSTRCRKPRRSWISSASRPSAPQVHIPLVLHGSSGVKEESEVEAIQYGIAKINVATMLNQAFSEALRESIAANPEEFDPRKLLLPSREAVKEVVRHKMRLFGSSGTVTSSGMVSPKTVHRGVNIGGVGSLASSPTGELADRAWRFSLRPIFVAGR